MFVFNKGSLPFYLGIGLLQGLAILAAMELESAALAVAALVVGINLQLLGTAKVQERSTWGLIALQALIMTAITAWIWSIRGTGSSSSWLPGNWVVCALLAGYIATTFTVSWPARHAGRVPYPALFQHAWNNAFIFFLALLLVQLFWGLILLCSKLFEMVGILAFKDLITSRYFIVFSLTLVFSLGMRMGSENDRIIGLLRGILLSLCRFLAPLAALIVVVFTLTLPFTGFNAIWNTGSASRILLSLVLVTVFLVNGVFQDGQQPPTYSRTLRWLINASLVCLPVLAGLAVQAAWLRIDQYGLSPLRCIGFLAVSLGFLHSLALLIAVLPRGGVWLGSVRTSNPALALVLYVTIILVHTPWLSPEQLSARNQVQRLVDGRTPVEQFDANTLYWRLGQPGREAFGRLLAGIDDLTQLSVADRDALRTHMGNVAERLRFGEKPAAPEVTPTWLGEPVEGHEQFTSDRLESAHCSSRPCFLWAVDLDRDGRNEVVHFSSGLSQMQFYRRMDDGQWVQGGYLQGNANTDKLAELIREGKARTVEPPYLNLEIDGRLYVPKDTTRP